MSGMCGAKPWKSLPESTLSMSNFDHSIPEGLEADLRAGMRATHAAWNFNGQVWHDAPEDVFKEEVFCYHVSVGRRSAATLEELMQAVNSDFGWD